MERSSLNNRELPEAMTTVRLWPSWEGKKASRSEAR